MKFTFPPESRPLEGFTLKRAIYRGGFGEVYYGISDAGREVALKLLQHNTEVELRGVQQCLNLSHPHLVTIFDVRKDADGDHWIVMEYIAGETLEAVIRRYPEGMPVETIRKWLPGIVSGVGYLHRCGLVHRDLKPANIFMENDVVKVGDVGLSKFISPGRQSAHTQSVGTVYYMAPEVAKGRYGKEVDVYALGVILYEMLTGDLPFDGESTGEILMKHLTEPPNLSKLPPRLRTVIAKALEKDADQRFPNMEEFLTAFDQAVLGKTSNETSPSGRPSAESSFTSPVQNATANDQPRTASNRISTVGRFLFWLIVSLIVVRLTDAEHPGIVMLAVLLGGMWISHRFSKSSQKSASKPVRSHNSCRPVATPVVSRAVRCQSGLTGINMSQALSASALLAPVACLLTTLLAAMRPSLFQLPETSQIDPGMLGLFTAGAILSGWGLTLIPALVGSFCHSTRTSRWWYALAGGLVGLITWNMSQYLLIEFPTGSEFATQAYFKHFGDHALLSETATPTKAGFVVYFAAVSFFGNWRTLTSPSRVKRFSLWGAMVAVMISWLVTRFVPFPFAWALAWPAVIACSLQLASPLIDRTAKYRSGTRSGQSR